MLVSRDPDSGNFQPAGGRNRQIPWLTLPCPFRHKSGRPPTPSSGIGGLHVSMARLVTGTGGRIERHRTGECPEWQRELTVNQPSYDFEGSSPSSPTSLRSRCDQGCRAEARRAKAGRCRASYGSAGQPASDDALHRICSILDRQAAADNQETLVAELSAGQLRATSSAAGGPDPARGGGPIVVRRSLRRRQ